MKDIEKNIPNMLSDETMLNDLRLMLNEELAKPENERNYDAVKEITAAMVELADDKVPPIPSADAILGKTAERKRSGIRVVKRWAAALSACFAVGIALNCYTLAAYGENLLEVVLKKTPSGFSLDLSNEPEDGNKVTQVSEFTTTEWVVPWKNVDTTETETVTTVTDAAETEPVTETSENKVAIPPEEMIGYIANTIKDFCGEHGVTPYVPSVLPDEMIYNGFFKAEEQHHESLPDSDDFYFTFTNGTEQQFTLTIEVYRSHDDLPEILIPSDNQKFIEGTENGIHVYAFPSRNRVTAIFTVGSSTYTLNGYNISADAVMQMAYSFIPTDSEMK